MSRNRRNRRGQRGPGEDDDDEVDAAVQLANGGGDEAGTSLGGRAKAKGGKKGKRNRRGADEDEEVERILQNIAEGKDDDDAQPAEDKKPGTGKHQQAKGGKKGKNNRRGAEDDEEVERVLQEIAEGKPPADAGTSLGGGGQKGGKGRNKNNRHDNDDDYNTPQQAEAEESKESPSAGTSLGGSGGQKQKGGKKGRRNQAADEDEEVERILQAIAEGKDVPESTSPPEPKQHKKGGGRKQEQSVAADEAADEGEGEGEGKKLSAAAKKRLKKKQKEKELKEQQAAAPTSKAGAAQPAKGKAGPQAAPAPKKGARSAIAAMILKQQEEERKRKEEEERLIREEEERIRKEAEEAARKQRELDAQRVVKREKNKLKKKDADKRRAERERQEKLARLGITVPVEEGAPKPKKPQSALYATKPKKQKQTDKATTEGEQPSAETDKVAEQVASPPAPEPKPAEPESWEDGIEEWEKKAEEPAATPSADTNVGTKIQEPVPTTSPTTPPTATKKQKKPEKPDTAEMSVADGEKKPALRSPICCILGHVDTGKTKLLDKIRQTNVQGGEAGGITQQIGASFFPLKALKEKTKVLAERLKFEIKVPGLLVIDTPGHESFTNLRSRGSSLCDIAILVVDLMHGLEPQTLESIKLLRQRKTPFIVALNKIDRIFGWKAIPDAPFRQTLNKQVPSAKQEFETRVRHTSTMFAEQGLNAELYYQNKDFIHNLSLIPTSAHTGEGIPDLLAVLIQLTQTKLSKRIITKELFQATVLEVKVVEGLGTTIDVILVNGVLREGDRIVVCGLDGPIVANIRALLTPHPLRELRVKTPYIHHKEVVAAQGVKIAAHGLDRAVAGSSLLVVGEKDDEQTLMSRVQSDLTDILKKVQKRGVSVQASTLGSLEALLRFLEESHIPVGAINIGPVHRADVIKASVNLDKGKKKEYGCILAFDVPVDRDAKTEAAKNGVRIFTADIIYHLFDQFTKFLEELKAKEKAEAALKVVFPCILEIVPDCIFNKKEPIIIGVRVVDGLLKIGTPLCVQKVVTYTDEEGRTRNKKEMLYLGKVTSLQDNHKEIPQATTDQQVAIKIEGSSVTFGRQFDETFQIYSQLSRESIDALKEHFREVLLANKGMVQLVQKLKPMFDIM